jgi:NAD(P)-dependent dehydrogenase (short-subunit alcohol dehydrogenase family)
MRGDTPTTRNSRPCSLPELAIGFIGGLANDVASANGITTSVVLPSLTNTPAKADKPDAAKKLVWQSHAIKRLAQPEDIAGPIAFLASEEASFITGQALVVDGGFLQDQLDTDISVQ